MKKRKLYIMYALLLIAYIPMLFIVLAVRNNIVVSIALLLGFLVYFGSLLYCLQTSSELNDDYFSSVDELIEKKKEVNKQWNIVHKLTKIIGEHEAIKLWEQQKQKDNEATTETGKSE